MAIKNYTTTVDVYKSLGEIQAALASHGARKIMVDYDAAGQPVGVMFGIETPDGPRGFSLPANVEGVRKSGPSLGRPSAQRGAMSAIGLWHRWQSSRPDRCRWMRCSSPT